MAHLTRAAEKLGRSQSAVTRSVLDLEQFLGVRLFERTATGMAKTREGEVLFRRVRSALDHMAGAGRFLAPNGSSGHGSQNVVPHFLDLDIGNPYVFAFLAVGDHRDIQQAARSLGVAPWTVRKLIADLEGQLATRLFDRAPRGIVYPTDFAQALAKATKRALWEIRAGLDELRSLDGRVEGQVRIGVMSTARSFIVPRAIHRLHERHPRVLVDIFWANYDDLKLALSCGEIDFIVGTLRTEELASADNVAESLLQDRVAVIARAGHPLSRARDVELPDLLRLDWLLPPPHFPLRRWFRSVLESQGLREPPPFIQTASLAILRGVLLESDCVALSTQLQCWHDIVEHGHLAVLPVGALSRAHARHPFHLHLTRRADAVLSPASQALCRLVAEVAREVEGTLGAGSRS